MRPETVRYLEEHVLPPLEESIGRLDSLIAAEEEIGAHNSVRGLKRQREANLGVINDLKGLGQHALFSDFAAAYDGLERIAHNQRGTVLGAVADKFAAPIRERWEWTPGDAPYVKLMEEGEVKAGTDQSQM